METPNAKRRPVLVVSRDEAIAVLDNVVVAPVTSTIRNIPRASRSDLTKASVTGALPPSTTSPPSPRRCSQFGWDASASTATT